MLFFVLCVECAATHMLLQGGPTCTFSFIVLISVGTGRVFIRHH